MTRPDPFTKLSHRAQAERAGFEFRIDDYAVQGRHPAHPMFWLRIDREESRHVRVTDLSPAGIAAADIAVVLAAALDILDHPNTNDLYLADTAAANSVATDLDPGGLRAAIAAFAKLNRKFVVSWTAEPVGQKLGWRAKIGN